MEQQAYKPQEIESQAQERWERGEVYRADEDSPGEKFYCLSMLPYPSGALHMGHVRNYTIGDIVSRYHRILGKNVLQPMGWDAFGLPAENAAIKHKTAPAKWTRENIKRMRDRFKRLGFAYDWRREVTTCDPEYYRWEQQMFTHLMRKGLAYRKDAEVNWDPVDQTVLANEQVVDGRGWRSGAVVERKSIPQWFLRITDYAEELLNGLDDLEGWPEAVKTMQRNWIGRSEGVDFEMQVCDLNGTPDPEGRSVKVFTTRPDTTFGMTYGVLAPEHPLVTVITSDDRREAVEDFVEKVRAFSETERLTVDSDGSSTMEKRGVFTGAYLLNPFSKEPVPLYIADYVLMGYGTGAIMAVPGEDERDWDFARAHDLPIVRTVQPPEDWEGGAFTDDGPKINSDWLNGLQIAEAKQKAIEWLEDSGIGESKVNYRLRDWGVSRQRYWGCPIPVIYCDACGAVPVPDEDLPVVLPEDVTFMGVQSPIKADPEWRKTTCPGCGGAAERETDTFDTFMESSWYYARYCSPGADAMIDDRADQWLPVNQYIGGIEHAILHLMYFRFFHKLLRDEGMVSSDEPATRLLCQGMVVAETYYREEDDGGCIWIHPDEVELERDDKGRVTSARLISDGQPVQIGAIEKMSKSKNNGVDPTGLIDHYGADTVRLFSVSDSPPDQSLEWSESGVEGAHRFLKRIWHMVHEHASGPECVDVEADSLNDGQKEMRRLLHDAIAKVSDDVERRFTFNTAVAAIMQLCNQLSRFDDESNQGRAVRQEAWLAVVRMIWPIAPHISESLWEALGCSEDIVTAGWPEVDESARIRQQLTLVIQINGKLRAKLEIQPGASQDVAVDQALALENVQRHIEGKDIRKVIHVPDRLLNIVVG
jgi:leucyl-tRNA synthetase